MHWKPSKIESSDGRAAAAVGGSAICQYWLHMESRPMSKQLKFQKRSFELRGWLGVLLHSLAQTSWKFIWHRLYFFLPVLEFWWEAKMWKVLREVGSQVHCQQLFSLSRRHHSSFNLAPLPLPPPFGVFLINRDILYRPYMHETKKIMSEVKRAISGKNIWLLTICIQPNKCCIHPPVYRVFQKECQK